MRLLSHKPDPGPSPVKTRAKRESDKKESPPSAQDGQDLFLKTIETALEEDLVNRKCVHVLLLLDTVLIILYSRMIIFIQLNDHFIQRNDHFIQRNDQFIQQSPSFFMLLSKSSSSVVVVVEFPS